MTTVKATTTATKIITTKTATMIRTTKLVNSHTHTVLQESSVAGWPQQLLPWLPAWITPNPKVPEEARWGSDCLRRRTSSWRGHSADRQRRFRPRPLVKLCLWFIIVKVLIQQNVHQVLKLLLHPIISQHYPSIVFPGLTDYCTKQLYCHTLLEHILWFHSDVLTGSETYKKSRLFLGMFSATSL